MSLHKVTITKRLEFDAGHRLTKHESKCSNFHGHRWFCDVTCGFSENRDSLDEVGRIIDFGKIKEVFGKWLDTYMDHNFIASINEDKNILEYMNKVNKKSIMQVNFEPTSENLSRLLFTIAKELLAPYDVEVLELDLWETPSSKASALVPFEGKSEDYYKLLKKE